MSCARGFGDGYGIARFEQGQRGLGIGGRRGQLLGRHIDGVLAAFEHIELGVDGFLKALGFLPDDVFSHDFVARPGDREVGFRGHDQAEGLQVGGHIEAALSVVIGNNLAQVLGTPFGVMAHQHIGQELRTYAACRPQLGEINVDLQASVLAVHLGFAGRFRHQARAFHVHGGGTAAMAIVHCLRGPRHHVHAEHRGLIHRLYRRVLLLGHGEPRQQHRANQDCEFLHDCILLFGTVCYPRPRRVSLDFGASRPHSGSVFASTTRASRKCVEPGRPCASQAEPAKPRRHAPEPLPDFGFGPPRRHMGNPCRLP